MYFCVADGVLQEEIMFGNSVSSNVVNVECVCVFCEVFVMLVLHIVYSKCYML